MTTPLTTHGFAHLDLVARLAELRPTTLDPATRALAVFCEIASTPCVWPLDDVLYELLLTAAGFRLTDADDLPGALWATALLIASDPSYNGLHCGHDDQPSILCELLHATDLDQLFLEAMDLAADGSFDPVYEMRARRCIEWRVVDDDGLAGAA